MDCFLTRPGHTLLMELYLAIHSSRCMACSEAIIIVQIPHSEGCASDLVLLAAARLGFPAASGVDADADWSDLPSVRLLPDPVLPDRLHCLHPRGVCLLRTPWLPALADQVPAGQSLESPRALKLHAVYCQLLSEGLQVWMQYVLTITQQGCCNGQKE